MSYPYKPNTEIWGLTLLSPFKGIISTLKLSLRFNMSHRIISNHILRLTFSSVIPSDRVAFRCGFETANITTDNNGKKSWCGLEQARNDQRDWSPSPSNGRTPSEPTGPLAPFRGQAFAYYEASSPSREGDQAK